MNNMTFAFLGLGLDFKQVILMKQNTSWNWFACKLVSTVSIKLHNLCLVESLHRFAQYADTRW